MMQKTANTRCFNAERGSASIEASVALVFFIFAIWAIYALADFCIVQAKISYAIDTTAKEISQYSYFYYKSGWQKGDAQLTEQSQLSLDAYTKFSEVINAGKVLKTDVSADSIGNLSDKARDAKGVAVDIIENPTDYLKSFASLGASMASSEAKHQIATQVARGMTRRHFGSTKSKANEVLERFGVEQGYDGLNFDASKMFDGDEKIEIVVAYSMDIKNVVPYFSSRIGVCQRAVTVGWLGGDAG